ncbi:hypothetical protein Acsp03_24560 [Actinomadura sp. NBRC 104412]|nr:hypothetical protein Acsp03_24560 [Actinomadura sp. NBRC 104412]
MDAAPASGAPAAEPDRAVGTGLQMVAEGADSLACGGPSLISPATIKGTFDDHHAEHPR